MRYVSLVILALLGGTWGLFALMMFWQGLRSLRSWRGCIRIIGAILMIYAVAGFFGAGFSACGGLDWLGSFEWPIGYTSGVSRTPSGDLVVPHDPSGRLQIYDGDRRFLRGWRVGSGKPFVARALAD